MKQLALVEHLARQGLPIYPQTLETYNAYSALFERGLNERKELLELSRESG